MSTHALIQVPTVTAAVTAAAPRLLEQVRQRALVHFGRPEPGERIMDWVRRFVIFHGMRHARELFPEDLGRFLEHVAQTDKDPRRALELGQEALTFLYAKVLQLPRDPFMCRQSVSATFAGTFTA